MLSYKLLDKDKEICYTYDNNGNILTKSVNGEVVEYRYKEDSDQLMSFGNETFAYDVMGNPTTYRGMTAVWKKGKQLKFLNASVNNVGYTHDGKGLRRTKHVGGITTTYTYDSNGKLLKEEGAKTIEYVYGAEGIIGIIIDQIPYLFRKNVFGDVTHIYNVNGGLVGKYSYTAFGECTVERDINGVASDNPIRYRSYYYDTETSLYYLKTRYYDPEIGRFMTIDDISYLDPDTINGLNLYAYCGNNPVMRVDENGNAWWEFWKWDWAKIGTTLGVVVATVGAIALTVVTLGAAAPVLAAGIIGGIAAFSTNIITQGISRGYNNIDWGHVAIQTVSGIAYGMASIFIPGVGGIIAKAGVSAATSYIANRYDGRSIENSILNAVASFGVSMAIQGLSKLNLSSWIGKGRWVDYVGENIFDQALIALDFNSYLTRELTIAGVAIGSRFINYIFNKIK